MPLDPSVFPGEVQVAFFIFSFLPDRWDGMSCTYLGKEWSAVEFFLDLYEIDDKKVVVHIMKLYEIKIVSYKAEEAERKRKQEQRKQKSGGNKYAHNVQG